MLNYIQNFARDEDGAVTVDWVVLTAAIVGLGIAVLTSVSTGAELMADNIEARAWHDRSRHRLLIRQVGPRARHRQKRLPAGAVGDRGRTGWCGPFSQPTRIYWPDSLCRRDRLVDTPFQPHCRLISPANNGGHASHERHTRPPNNPGA